MKKFIKIRKLFDSKILKKNTLRTWISTEILHYPVPLNLNYIFSVGSVLGIFFVLQIFTGIFLAMHYTPEISMAFESVQHIMINVKYGSTIRYMHSNGASMIFLCIYIHIAKGIFFKSYVQDRKYIWWSGIMIFVLMMATAFLGYILPWGQMSLWGATVISNLLTAIPYIGEFLRDWIWGGYAVDGPTLKRFYSLHYCLPALTSGFIGLHLLALHRNTSSSGIQIPATEMKIEFHPYFTYKDTVAFLFSAIIFSFFIFFEPNYLGHPENYIPANPLVTPEHIVPEWYFTPFYAILRSCTNKYGGVISMALSILIWGFLPLFKINISSRSVFESEPHKIFFIIFIFSFLALCKLGGLAPTYYYVMASKIFTIYYFLYFILILPNLYIFENKIYFKNKNR